LKYPRKAIEDSIFGVVMTEFDVDSEGVVRNVVTKRSVRFDLDSACFDVVNKMPHWSKVRTIYDEPTMVRFVLPVRFIIRD